MVNTHDVMYNRFLVSESRADKCSTLHSHPLFKHDYFHCHKPSYCPAQTPVRMQQESSAAGVVSFFWKGPKQTYYPWSACESVHAFLTPTFSQLLLEAGRCTLFSSPYRGMLLESKAVSSAWSRAACGCDPSHAAAVMLCDSDAEKETHDFRPQGSGML